MGIDAPDEATPPPLDRQRVLLAENEAAIAQLVERHLRRLGAREVTLAASLAEALAGARALDVDLAVFDVELGDGLSFPAAEVLHRRGIPIVFVTASSLRPPASLARLPRLGKPFTSAALTSALLAAIRGTARVPQGGLAWHPNSGGLRLGASDHP